MSGHSKWSTIKRKKGAKDARKSKIWARIARDIMVAAKDGGGDQGMNPHLAVAIEKAKSENMPKDNIERAIKRGTGEIEGADYVEISYEGYASSGIAVFVEALTDNTYRTVADVRSIMSKAGGSLGQNGSVAYLFSRKGVFDVPAAGVDESRLFEVVADAGAEDLELSGDQFIVTCEVEAFGSVQSALEKARIRVEEASLQRVPLSTNSLDIDAARKITQLIEKLEDHPDVQAVYTNLEFDDALMAELS